MSFFFEIVNIAHETQFDRCFVFKQNEKQCIKNNIIIVKIKKKNKQFKAKIESKYQEAINQFCDQHEKEWFCWLKTKKDSRVNQRLL